MKRAPQPIPHAITAVRIKRLPRRHRIAHLRALIRLQQAGSLRRQQLAAWLGDEMPAPSGEEMRAR
jgi:hypothetical protein